MEAVHVCRLPASLRACTDCNTATRTRREALSIGALHSRPCALNHYVVSQQPLVKAASAWVAASQRSPATLPTTTTLAPSIAASDKHAPATTAAAFPACLAATPPATAPTLPRGVLSLASAKKASIEDLECALCSVRGEERMKRWRSRHATSQGEGRRGKLMEALQKSGVLAALS